MWHDKIKIENCPICYRKINCEFKEDNFDKKIKCSYCNKEFIVTKNIQEKTIESDSRILYCPVCSCTNAQWVRQKKMPYKCKHELCKFTGVISILN